ncbi:hypothetical protein ACFVAF_18250 [Streptomyces sp. NPDC057596]|uniref:hypothetical protein n=1 Tax=Streptomyces sp. NPDC057596 TaxID=3346178 RepID=UPI0036A1929E
MNFTLTGHDRLSRVFDRIGDRAQRLHRRIDDAATRSNVAMNRFTSNTTRRLSQMQQDSEAGGKALEKLAGAALLLAPAAIPVAATLAPIAAGAGTVAVAVAAMGAALIPQISALGEAAEAETKWQDAVDKSGATSAEAAQAQAAYAKSMADLPPATRKAAASFGVLKDNYKDWSDELAGDTMAPFIKSMGIANALLPKTSGLVKAASSETDRFLTIIGGSMASPGFDRLNDKFTTFTQKTLRNLNDGLVHLMRTSDGKVGSNLAEFMDYARAQGPLVSSVLRNIGTTLMNVLRAGSDVGVGMLQVINVLAKLVSAVPPGTIAALLQLAFAMKVTKAAAFGLAAARTAVAAFMTQLIAMGNAAAGTPGRLRAVGAAIGALSRSAKVALAGTGIGLLLVALAELQQRGKSTPPDIDKLTTSLGTLGRTGKVTGEAARVMGKDMGDLAAAVERVAGNGSGMDRFNDFMNKVFTLGMADSNSMKAAKEDLDGIDQALANLVKGGNADLAEAALKRMTAAYGKGGRDTSELTSRLDAYKSALADAKLEQELTADSMGLFGAQALSVQQKLNAQKLSADGLRQSIQALNDVQRQGLGGMIGFEASIDAATKAAKENAGALKMSHGELDLNSEKARNAASALNDLASKTEEAASQARESGAGWEKVNGIYSRGRAELIKNARAMGLNKQEAKQLADQILNIKDLKKVRVEMETQDAVAGLDSVIAAIKRTPGSKKVRVESLTSEAISALEAVGFKVTHMKDGSFTVTAKTGTAMSNLGAVVRLRDGIKDKSVTFTVTTHYRITGSGAAQVAYSRTGGGHQFAGNASGGLVRGYASGGDVQYFPAGGLISGPGGPRSDSIFAMFASGARARVSNTEYVVQSSAVSRYGVPFLDALNSGRLSPALLKMMATGLAGGGVTGAGADVARGLVHGMTGSTGQVEAGARLMAAGVVAGIKTELEIASPSKKTRALAKDVGRGFIQGLTSTRAKIKSVSADLVKDIKTAFSGKKESSLVASVNFQTSRLMALAAKRDKIAAKIAEAKQYAKDVTSNARSQASLGNLGMQPEEVTAGGIKAGLAAKLAKVKHFVKYIDILAKKGLNKGLLRQILNMGPEDGWAYASALVGADKATFKQINSLQSQLDKSTDTLGKRGADILYDSGKNAGKGFLTGLASQQKDIEKLMLKIAQGMQKSIKKALGIKSPSTVMAKLGSFSTQGLARGLVGALPEVDRALGVVTGRVASAQPVLGRPAAVRGGGGGMVVHLTVEVAPTADRVAIGKEIQTALLALKRNTGGVSLGLT